MTNSPPDPASNTNTATGPAPAAETKQIILKEIGAKWGKFSERDLSSLKNKDDLVTQVVAKYGLEKSVAQRRRRPDERPFYLSRRSRAEAAGTRPRRSPEEAGPSVP
jgi:hypothetical protein